MHIRILLNIIERSIDGNAAQVGTVCSLVLTLLKVNLIYVSETSIVLALVILSEHQCRRFFLSVFLILVHYVLFLNSNFLILN